MKVMKVMKVMTKSSAVHWFPLTFHPLNPSPKPISSQFQESFQCQFQRPGAPGGTIHPPYIAGGKLRKCYGKLLDLIHSNRLKWHDGKKTHGEFGCTLFTTDGYRLAKFMHF
jgi:hypothetical protein